MSGVLILTIRGHGLAGSVYDAPNFGNFVVPWRLWTPGLLTGPLTA
jgi:hypothetical protein